MCGVCDIVGERMRIICVVYVQKLWLTRSLKQHSVDSPRLWLVNLPPFCHGGVTNPRLINRNYKSRARTEVSRFPI